MARVRMVTRSITSSTCTTLCMDITSAQAVVKELVLTGEKYTLETALKELQKLYNTDELKVVAVTGIVETEDIFGMPEVEFMSMARKLEKR